MQSIQHALRKSLKYNSQTVCCALKHRQFATEVAALPKIRSSEEAVFVAFPNAEETKFHNRFLRDHCLCGSCHHSLTKQRLLDSHKILPISNKPAQVAESSEGLKLQWNDGHQSVYPWTWMRQHAYLPQLVANGDQISRTLWSNRIAGSEPSVEYTEVMESDRGVLKWLDKINEYGFCFVNGTPPDPEKTEELIRRITFVRETHYGGFWSFTADFAKGDLAYSNVALANHTDTTYFSSPCGLQMFHLLSPRDTHEGGHSTLVDGFRAATLLQTAHPALYHLLSTLPIPTHASGGDDTLISPLVHRPVLEHDQEGQLSVVRWNNDDRAVIGQGPGWQGTVILDDGREVDKVEGFYEALEAWENILRADDAILEFPMEPGRPFIFDNMRVLHGRTSFTGKRTLCGAYLNGDDVRSRWRVLRRKYKT